jgi:hypothetical protein
MIDSKQATEALTGIVGMGIVSVPVAVSIIADDVATTGLSS